MHNSNTEQKAGSAERDDSDALKETLGITARIIEAAAPPETYWPAYHAKLRGKLKQARESTVATESRSSGPLLASFFRASVSVPVPLGLALIIVFSGMLLFAFSNLRQNAPVPQIVHVPVEVPVVQEKIVTRVVYRSVARSSKRVIDAAKVDSTFAKSRKPQSPEPSLIGFTPTEEVKLTVIKGGSQNEK